ncbi:MAG TPA: hypothetical protein VNL16_12155 [Chloroflexota bacterium]|nr:hypothetical protein [Chloroflexota bacterium]
MRQWVVAEFMSRVAERVSTAGGGFAAQLSRRRPEAWDDLTVEPLDNAFPFVEPAPGFVESLRAQLLEAAVMVPADVVATSSMATRRALYGIAAVGSIASAAVIAVVVFRSRASAQRPAA